MKRERLFAFHEYRVMIGAVAFGYDARPYRAQGLRQENMVELRARDRLRAFSGQGVLEAVCIELPPHVQTFAAPCEYRAKAPAEKPIKERYARRFQNIEIAAHDAR